MITPLFYLISDILKIFYNYNIPFYNYYFVNWFSYYYLGMIIKETKLHWQKGKTNKLIVISLLLSIIYRMFIYNKFGYYDYAVTQITLLNFFFSIFMCLLMFSKIDNLKIKNNILLNFGNYSFGIYLSHVLFAMVFKKIVLYFNLPYLLNILIIFTLTCMVTYICNMIYYEKIKGRIIWKK